MNVIQSSPERRPFENGVSARLHASLIEMALNVGLHCSGAICSSEGRCVVGKPIAHRAQLCWFARDSSDSVKARGRVGNALYLLSTVSENCFRCRV